MFKHMTSRLSSRAKDESGQALVVVSFAMIVMFGFAGLVIDFGRVYIAYHQLQSSTDAAAMAGAEQLPNSTAVSMATTFSATGANNNHYTNLPNVTFPTGYPQVKCLAALTAQGESCIAPGNGNAVQVVQQVTVKLYFGGLFGMPSFTMSSKATAAMRGANSTPYNVAIIIDSTASMGSNTDSSCGGITRIKCALNGVQTLLQNMSPCAASYSSCVFTNNVATNAVDTVSLFTFPNVYASQAGGSTTTPTIGQLCNGYGSGTLPVYTFPSTTATTYTNLNSATPTATATYMVTPFWSDYRTSDLSGSLNTASYLVQDAGGKSGCSGMTTPGGDGTYYAGAIYAAQAELVHQASLRSGSQNVIIFLSDGDAQSTKFQTAAPGFSTTSGTYPSSKNQCAQAVTAAKAATAAGTTVYTVAYGAATTGTCSTDTGTYAGSSCAALRDMASTLASFYSADYNSSNGCQSQAQPTSNLNQIFTSIANDFTQSRLIPDNVT